MSEFLDRNESQKSNLENFDFEHLLSHLNERVSTDPQFIHIGGVSAAGKTTLSRMLQATLPEASSFSIDSYLIEGLGKMTGVFDDESPNPLRPYIGGINPAVWEMSLVKRHVQELKRNGTIQVPIFDETIKDRIGYREFVPGRYIIFEGGHSFNDVFRNYADYKILVKAPFHDRLTRKIVRTHALYMRDDMDDIVGRYLTKDEPVWRIYEEEFTELADQVFINPAHPDRDYVDMPRSRYSKIEGSYFHLRPKKDFGELKDGEEFGFIQNKDGMSQICYSAAGKEIVNLALEGTFIELLMNYYDVTPSLSGDGHVNT